MKPSIQHDNSTDFSEFLLQVREKLLNMATIQSEKMQEDLKSGVPGGEGAGAVPLKSPAGVQPEMVSTHAHAPVVSLKEPSGTKEEEEEEAAVVAAHLRQRPASLVRCSGLTELLSKAEAPKKTDRKSAKEAIKTRADAVATSLNASGWVVCDEFAPAQLVAAIRKELATVATFYEPSEIWVGKEAGLGAQITVPDVRGDKIMWMCGGHASTGPSTMYESAGEQPRTKGALEPCDRKVKNKLAAGGAARVTTSLMSKFASIRQLIKLVDQLVFDQLKGRVTKLSRVAERSDAMLAVYPGKGTRFQKHVDNTAGDGRVLTVLIYLNTDWKEENGGALRVFPSEARVAADASHGECGPVDVYPECGRLAMFFADEVAHEVRPTRASRHAVTVWYYDETLRKNAVSNASDKASASASGGALPSVGVGSSAKMEASNFMHNVLAPTDWLAGGERPTQR